MVVGVSLLLKSVLLVFFILFYPRVSYSGNNSYLYKSYLTHAQDTKSLQSLKVCVGKGKNCKTEFKDGVIILYDMTKIIFLDIVKVQIPYL